MICIVSGGALNLNSTHSLTLDYYSAIYNHSLRNLNSEGFFGSPAWKGSMLPQYQFANQSQFYVSFSEKLLKIVAILGYSFFLKFTK